MKPLVCLHFPVRNMSMITLFRLLLNLPEYLLGVCGFRNKVMIWLSLEGAQSIKRLLFWFKFIVTTREGQLQYNISSFIANPSKNSDFGSLLVTVKIKDASANTFGAVYLSPRRNDGTLSVLFMENPWTEEPERLLSMGSFSRTLSNCLYC